MRISQKKYVKREPTMSELVKKTIVLIANGNQALLCAPCAPALRKMLPVNRIEIRALKDDHKSEENKT